MTPRARVLSIAAAIVVPVALLTAVVLLRDGSDGPAELPISIGAAETGKQGDSAMAAADIGYLPVTYQTGLDLPALDGSGRAYRFTGDVTADRTRELAAALGVDGEAEDDGAGGFTVSNDEASLSVYGDAGGSWYYGPRLVSRLGEAPDSTDERPANLPTKEAAEQIARVLLASGGVDVDHARFRVEDGYAAWYVTADPEVDGLPTTGIGSSVTVGPEGRVESASGYLATAEAADEYPLIGTTAAIGQLNGSTTMPADAEPQVVTVTRAEQGLLAAPSGDGKELWLVPAYLLTTDDGAGVTPVLAIDDDHIAPPEPIVEPEPQPEPPIATDSGSSEPTMTIEIPPVAGCAPPTTAIGAEGPPVCE